MSKTMSSAQKNKKILIVSVGLLIAYLPSYVPRLMNWTGIQIGPDGPPAAMIWNWLAVGLLLSYIIFVERRRLSSILLVKPKKQDIEWALWFLGIATTTSWLATVLFPQDDNQGMSQLLGYSLPVIFGVIATAAITEEILFRGYVIERLKELTSMAWLAVGVSFFIFILPHITFFGLDWLLYHGVGTIMIYVLYVWRKNLYACMLLHLLGNLPILLLATGIVA